MAFKGFENMHRKIEEGYPEENPELNDALEFWDKHDARFKRWQRRNNIIDHGFYVFSTGRSHSNRFTTIGQYFDGIFQTFGGGYTWESVKVIRRIRIKELEGKACH